jgi:Lrp/AsnC family leucine-responsive transcriptional regulator
MDKIDLVILEELKKNSRATASEISKRVQLSVPAVAERLKKLEQRGIIEQYTVKLNRQLQGWGLLAFVLVSIDTAEHNLAFAQAVLKMENVLECHRVAGKADYLLKVAVRDPQELEDFIMNSLKNAQGFLSSNTIVCLSTLKEECNI